MSAVGPGLKVWLRNAIFTLLVPGTVAGLVPHWILGSWSGVEPTAARLPGFALLGAGLAIYLRCLVDFALSGGTPAPIDPPKELVVRHLYRYSRNPMYVGVLALILGQAWLFASPALALYAAAVFGLFQSFIVFYEEPTLRRLFGEVYRRYSARVPRWLGPVGPPR